jgi:hypothetical protein
MEFVVGGGVASLPQPLKKTKPIATPETHK